MVTGAQKWRPVATLPDSLALIVAKKRSKPLRLDTAELPENFKKRS
jgi:hypothetical protein